MVPDFCRNTGSSGHCRLPFQPILQPVLLHQHHLPEGGRESWAFALLAGKKLASSRLNALWDGLGFEAIGLGRGPAASCPTGHLLTS